MPHNRLSQVARAGMVGLVGAALLLLPGVADQPRMRLVAEVTMNDTYLELQWNLKDKDPAAIRALDAWDPEWQFAANQGEHGYVYPKDPVTGVPNASSTLVRYGAYGRSWTYAWASGDFVCGPATFPADDPAPGVVKRCEVEPSWINRVADGDLVNVPSGHGEETWVRYGLPEHWRYAKVDRSQVCGLDLVGGVDPIFGYHKICQVQLRYDGGGVVADGGQSFTTPQFDYDHIAASRTVTVRYGALDHWVYKDLPANTDEKCVPVTFGEDPWFGVVKHCEIVRSMGTGVTIANIDGGSLPHPDLDAKLVEGLNFYDSTKTNADDCPFGHPYRMHGLATASVAAATTNNRQGIAGVAPMAKVSQLKVSNCTTGFGSFKADADAIRWAAGLPTPPWPQNQHPAKIVTIPFGSPNTPCDPLVQSAIDDAKATGTYVIAAAGNDALDLATANEFPLDCQGVAPITAVDRQGQRKADANFGAAVGVAAPGVDIPVLSTSAIDGVQTNAGGTSFAAPQAAGVAALMLGKNPKLTVTNVNNRIQLSSREFPTACIGCGVGLLDADRAMRSAEAITQETEPNDYRGTANYVSAPADVAGQLTPRIPFSMCNQTCPPQTPSPDQDWFLLELPPGQTLAAWARTSSPCVNCYLDIITDTTATKTYAFSDTAASSATARLVNTSPTHQAVFVRVWTTEKNLSPSYTLFTSWRDERRPDGTVGVEKTELR